jgi:tripartite-type tricarboxylate transporter receptor subunit TctC
MGFKDVEFYLWVGLFAPAKIEKALEQGIRQDIGRAVRDPEFVKHMAGLGAPVDYRDAPAFKEFLNQDRVRIQAAIKRIGKVE